MYDIKSIETGNTTNQQNEFVTSKFYENLNKNYKQRHTSNNSKLNNNNNSNNNNNNNNNNLNHNINCTSISSQIPENNTMFLTFRRRRIFNRQTCLISIMAAFIFGLSLGVFLPMVSMTASAFTTELVPSPSPQAINSNNNNNNNNLLKSNIKYDISNDDDGEFNNILPSQNLKIATATTSVIVAKNINAAALPANKTSLNNINKSNRNLNVINDADDDNDNEYNNSENNEPHDIYIPKHPVSDFPTIYELKEQQLKQLQQQISDSNIRNEETQAFSKNHNNNTPPSSIGNSINTALDTSDGIKSNSNGFSVTFIKEKELPVEEIFRNAFHLEQDKSSIDTMIVKKLNDANDGSIKEFLKLHTKNGHIHQSKGSEYNHASSISLNNDNIDIDNISNGAVKVNSSDRIDIDDDYLKIEKMQEKNSNSDGSVNFVTVKLKNSNKKSSHSLNENVNNGNGNLENYKYNQKSETDQYEKHNFIKNDIYWGDLVENAIPKGYDHDDIENWNYYVQNTGIVKTLENGCGRMQNRLVVFSDGKRACARYRQNTDQIQGELFSFYLGQLLNLTNLAPSAASVIDFKIDTWSVAQQDLQNAQWKQTRPVVLTKWLPDLEPAGIPIPFQPLERHLNKYDVWNITLSTMMESKKMLINQKEHQQQQQKQQHNIHFEQENKKHIIDIQRQQQQQQQQPDHQNEYNHHQFDRKLTQQKKYHEDLNNKILNKYQYIQPQHQQQQQNQENQQEYQQNIEQDKKGLLERLGANRFNNDNQSYRKSADSISIDITNKKYHDTNKDPLINHSGSIINNNKKNFNSNNDNNDNNNSNNNDSDSIDIENQSISSKNQSNLIVKRLIELAQWSDLIIFDYLIANLDRVVNNLYNFQWNADIMAAPAHNLARQIDSQLLVFLDNESGLLHGYRLLKKYETYHSLLLDNLCVFREPTINALKRIKEYGPGQLLQDIFEQSTSHQLRDVLPSLPDKSIKILTDRIDRVLGQVQKCQDLFSNR